MEKRLKEISAKQVFETGNEKQFIRAKDIVWLINKVETQQKEIEIRNQKILQQENIIIENAKNYEEKILKLQQRNEKYKEMILQDTFDAAFNEPDDEDEDDL